MRTFIVVVLMAATALAPTQPGDSFSQAGEKKPRKPRFTISRETTFFTGPRDADGFIDYAQALNEHLSKGINPENNANVLLWRSWGPHPERATMPQEFFDWMGIPSPPEGDDYYIDAHDYARKRLRIDPTAQEFQDELDRTESRPWKAKDHIEIAGWLKANDRPLRLVTQAANRPRYFSPLCPPRKGKAAPLIAVLLPGIQKTREYARTLTTRAMLHIGEGRTEEAWQDLLTLHRLGRHVASGPTLIEGLVGVAIDNIASRASAIFLDRAQLDARLVHKCLRELIDLPPMPSFADKVDLCERCMFLDAVTMIDRDGVDALQHLSLLGLPVPDDLPKDILDGFQWDEGLRQANRRYDQMAAAMRLGGDRAGREKRLAEIEADVKKVRDDLADPLKAIKLLQDKKATPQARGKLACEALVSLLLPAVRKVVLAGERAEQTHRNLYVAFALAAHERDTGAYPKRLDDLVPKYLKAIPGDLFSGKQLIYRPAKKGFLLYSVGMNGKDENGHFYDDDPPGDDLRVKIPFPEPKKEQAKEEKKDEKKMRFTLGRETTHVLGPRDRDGCIDYVFALNERLKKGLTPDNNCVAKLLDIIGPRPEGARLSADFYRWLGRAEPPEKGDYLVGHYPYMKKHLALEAGKEWQDVQDDMDLAAARPWKTRDYPHIAGWLLVDGKALDRVREAVQLPRYFHPIVPGRAGDGSGGLLSALIPTAARCRDLGYSLSIRAMWHLGEGRHDEAWADLLALHRLSRHVASGASSIEGLVGIALHAIASEADLVFLEHARLDAKRIQHCLRDLVELPPMPLMADKLALWERFAFLDTVMRLERGGSAVHEDLDLLARRGGMEPFPELPQDRLDWDPGLKRANHYLDRASAAMRLKDRPKRLKAMKALEDELKAARKRLLDSGELARILTDEKTTAAERGAALGEGLLSLLAPWIARLQEASDRAEQTERNLRLAFALAAFRAEHGKYPARLEELSPTRLAEIPGDLYSGKPLIYRPFDKGYLLYSVGPNGKDEAGRWHDDTPAGDDPRVRVPMVEAKKK